MNTVTDKHLGTVEYAEIPLQSICVSNTHIQRLRRQHFDAEKLLELAQSIAVNGVLQPILVRVAPTATELIRYEIIAGERRYLAADRAGLAHIPCIVRDLSDSQVLEAQLVENLQREGLHALEEAEGYRELLDLNKTLTAETLGEKIGRSRSYVYARLKLLDLIPAAREAMASGELDATKGLILARIRGEKMQARALKLIRANEGHYSYRRLMEHLRSDCMIPLKDAAWNGRDTLHLPKTGEPVQACDTCPHNSGNDMELNDALDGAAYVCTDRQCFDLKTKLHMARLRTEAQAAGKTVLSGDAAAEVLDLRGGYMASDVKDGWVRLDASCDTIEFPEAEPTQAKGEPEEEFDKRWGAWSTRECDYRPPSYRELLGELPDTILAEGKAGKLIEVAPVGAVAKALKAKGIKVPSELKPQRARDDDGETEPVQSEAERRAAHEKAEQAHRVELEYRKRLLQQIHGKFKGPFKQTDLAMIAEQLLDNGKYLLFDMLYDEKRPDLNKFKEADLMRLIIAFCLDDEADQTHRKPGAMLAYCHRLKIDPKKIRAEVVKDLKPVSAGTAESKDKGAKK